MSLSDDFNTFCNDILLKNRADMETSAGEIAKKLNNVYYDLSSEKEEHMYIVGSVGRESAIKGSSDLDLIFDLPNETYKKFDNYTGNGQSALLQEVKDHLKERYPKTKLRGDGQVVVIEFTNYTVELVPGFKQSDGKFKYPDTHDGGSWKKTDPIPEKEESKNFDIETGGNFLNFCHTIRAWKNKKGFKFSGLLIDTLVYNFFNDNTSYKAVGYDAYLEVLKELFNYLKGLNKQQSYWYALGSNQHVYNTDNGNFIDKAKEAYEEIKDLDEESENINDVLRNLLGTEFPKKEVATEQANLYKGLYTRKYRNTEEFIERKFPVDIRYNLVIDCKVTQDGWRDQWLSAILKQRGLLRINKKLDFYIDYTDAPEPYDIYWKVKNEGEVAIQKDCIRGQVIRTNNKHQKERTDFKGPHYVECYLVKNNVCVARARINVPIGNF
ncbi:nucleotide-binding domain-containing protein [Desulforamulus ferrireducens]|jgi:hypothetical protein|uniref:Adenylyl/Guanylyl and SMODS C-terminal sensor domain-containing protein n=1 Tax=Desulforamulus ferrireducens TaxID=1833852 RepID=A0A1S6IZR5_9FIRM|nr:nucleotidyltransferase [Desulforamulus ferrireducens]AQS60262.1 hypothetical protein B0537_14985 [Desulforamulus ferrireducens]